jgi:hypothetical protein
MLSERARVVAGDDTVIREVNGEAVLLHLVSEQYYALDALSTHFWEVLTSRASLGEALRELEALYDVDSEVLRKDVLEFVEALTSFGLLEVQAEG